LDDHYLTANAAIVLIPSAGQHTRVKTDADLSSVAS
jgi:hypothetical protein